jgi:hypothetical protein
VKELASSASQNAGKFSFRAPNAQMAHGKLEIPPPAVIPSVARDLMIVAEQTLRITLTQPTLNAVVSTKHCCRLEIPRYARDDSLKLTMTQRGAEGDTAGGSG